MNKKDVVYITGHQHPDADSIASAIAYAFYKKAMGISAIPCRLGKINSETRYLLDRFGFPEPMMLSDARITLGELALDPPTHISPNTTIRESLQMMQSGKHTYCGVVDEEMHLLGLVTKSDISVIGLEDTAQSIAIMAHTPTENFRIAIDGKTVYDAPDMKLNGKVSMIAMTDPQKINDYEVSERIVICGSHIETQKNLIKKGAGLLIAVWTNEIDPEVLELAKEHHCSLILSGHGSMNTSRYLYFAPSVSQIMSKNLISFTENELAEDVGNKMLRSRYHIYPVTDNEKHLIGYASRYHIMNGKNRKLILVDHNEFTQSVRAIEKAQVLEVVDHHRINDFTSTRPVQFRNEIVGSTATVIATIFRENQVPIPQNLAGLLLGALLSDTMNFHSPTTTERDRQTANILAAMADLDLDEFAADLFSLTVGTENSTPQELLKMDVKIFDVQGMKFSVSQVMVGSTSDIRQSGIEIRQALNHFCDKKNLDMSALVFSSILENGSTIYFGGPRADWGYEAFPDKPGEEHSFHEGLLSRKQQIMPTLTEVILRYS